MVGAADCWPMQSKRQTIAPARTAWQAPTSTLGQARPSIGTSCGQGLPVTVLISSAARHDPHRRAAIDHDPHRRGSVITIRIGRAGHHDPYRHRVTVPDWHKCKRTSPPTDKPSLWMGRPPISLAYMISPAYRSGLNDKFCLYSTPVLLRMILNFKNLHIDLPPRYAPSRF